MLSPPPEGRPWLEPLQTADATVAIGCLTSPPSECSDDTTIFTPPSSTAEEALTSWPFHTACYVATRTTATHHEIPLSTSAPTPGSSWDRLNVLNPIQKNVISRGMRVPTNTQHCALKKFDEHPDKDIVMKAPIGDGKTTGLCILMSRHANKTADKRRSCLGSARRSGSPAIPLALAVVPTEALARQMHNHLQVFNFSTPTSSKLVIGGLGGSAAPADLVVGTPGAILNLAQQGHVSGPVPLLIIDELGTMMDASWAVQLKMFWGRGLVDEKTRFFFSSSFLSEKTLFNASVFLGYDIRHSSKAMVIRPGRGSPVHNGRFITQFFRPRISADPALNLIPVLRSTVREDKRVVVFCSTKYACDRLGLDIARAGGLDGNFAVRHSNMHRSDRDSVFTQFHRGDLKIMITTSSLSGVVLPRVDLVVHWSLPQGLYADKKGHFQEYLTRNGIVGRRGHDPCSLAYYSPHNRSLFPSIAAHLVESRQRNSAADTIYLLDRFHEVIPE